MCDDSTTFDSGHGGDAVAETAALWLARQDRGLTPAEARELYEWQAADPRHAMELARLEEAWSGFELAKASPKLAGMARATRRTPHQRIMGRKWISWAGLVGAAAAVIVAAIWWPQAIRPGADASDSTVAYKVVTPAASRLALPDGSVAEVRDDGEVRPEYTAGERRVRLIRGEAHFTVAENVARPFIVSAGGIDVRAVGTAFNVRLDARQVEVLVTEGRVHVAEPTASGDVPLPLVEMGQRAVVERAETIAAVRKIEISAAAPAEIEQALAWQGTRLVFNRTPLEDAVEAFNRYSADPSRPRLVLGDAALRSLRWGGTFRASNVEGFVHLLERSAEVRTERRENEIVLFRAR